MKMIRLTLCCAALLFIACPPSIAGTIRLRYGSSQTIDCTITYWPYCNGSQEYGMVVYYNTNGRWERYYSHIPLTMFTDSTVSITSAVLRMYVENVYYDNPNDYRLTINRLAQPLTSSYRAVSHASAPDCYYTPTIGTTGILGANYTGWVEFDVTDLVRGWIGRTFPNDGFLIRILYEDASSYARTGVYQSSCSNLARRPVLEITGPTLSDTTVVSDTVNTSVESLPPYARPFMPQLKANYPNPFNPSTTVTYLVASAGHVTLRVFNALGQEVATLVDGPVSPGQHAVRWDAGPLPSGVYFARLQISGVTQTHRMVLLR